MSDEKSGNDSAFPQVTSDYDLVYGHNANDGTKVVCEVSSTGGLSKRELFAAMAMQGHLSNPEVFKEDWQNATMVNWAVSMADALLAELDKKATPAPKGRG